MPGYPYSAIMKHLAYMQLNSFKP